MDQPRRQALIYARISQDREGAGLGVERQIQDCVRLADELGWTVVGQHEDNDISAYSGKPRPGYRQLLVDLEAGKATGVLAWHPDRLHRRPTELEHYIKICENHGVITHTAMAGRWDLSTASGRHNARTIGNSARYESELKSERIRLQRRQSAMDGKWTGGVRPFGFQKDGVRHNVLEAAVIRRAIEALLAGSSLRSVVREANESGLLTTFRREAWAANSFKAMLLRPRNAGLREHLGEEVGPAVWQPIVAVELWRAAVKILNDPSRRTSPGNRIRWFGSGLYLCGRCGSTLMVSTSGARRSAAYRCRGASKGHVTRTAAPLDEFVSDLIIGRLSRPDAVGLLRPAKPEVDLDRLRANAHAAQNRLEEIAAAFGDGDMSRLEWHTAKTRAEKRKADAESALTEATVPSALEGLVGEPNIAEVWPGLDLGRRRAVLAELMTVTVLPAPVRGGRGGFDPDGVRVEWNS